MGKMNGASAKFLNWGLLALLCILAFWPMFRNGFVWDDEQYIVGNPAIRGLWPPGRFLNAYEQLGGIQANPLGQRPVMAFSFALDYAVSKLNPFAYHLQNLILHIVCVLGVAFLAQRLSGSSGAGFLAGALFALHPGHAEGVISFLGRSDLQVTLFILVGLWGYVQHLRFTGSQRAGWYALSLLSFALGCFAKESGLVLVGVLVIYEGFVSGKGAGKWWKKGLRLVPYLGIALVYAWVWETFKSGEAAKFTWWGGNPGRNFLMAFEVYARYLRLLFFPITLDPAQRVLVPNGFWDSQALLGLGLLLLSVAGAIWLLLRRPKVGFMVSWFLLGLVPVSNLVPLPRLIAAERWLYLPSVGLCVLGGWGAWVLYRRTRGWVRAAWIGLIGLVLVLFGIRTWLWNPAWGSEESLAKAIIAADPGYELGYSDLGSALAKEGKYQEAEKECRKAIRLEPNDAIAHSTLGVALAMQGKLAEAEQECREAIRVKPNYAEAYFNLGNVLDGDGRLYEAEQAFRKAIEIKPSYAEARVNLGNTLSGEGKLDEAVESYRDAIKLSPEDAEAHFDLGTVLGQQGKLEESVQECREAVRLKPDYAEALENLAYTLDKLGRRTEAREFWARAGKIEKRPGWQGLIQKRLGEPD
jgi:tetratricopeptide (TPR) repeat protein